MAGESPVVNQGFLKTAWEWFFPSVCAGCGVPVNPGRELPLCGECEAELVFYDPPACPCRLDSATPWDERHIHCELCRGLPAGSFSSVRSAFQYAGTAGELVRNLKYRRREHLASLIARAAVGTSGNELRAMVEQGKIDLAAPVPLHFTRRWNRGFNQSDLIAHEMSLLLEVEYCPDAAARVRQTPRQTSMRTSKQRLANVKDAFAVPDPALVAGRKILLVDDVLTTGATAAACGKALYDSGARAVHVFTVTRAGFDPLAASYLDSV